MMSQLPHVCKLDITLYLCVSETSSSCSYQQLRFNYGDLEQQQLNKAFSSMERRIRAASPLQLSFRDRTLYLSFYVLSLPHYHHSTLLPTPPLLDRYTSLIRKFLCNRPWIQAQHLPGIVTYLKLGILHCPKIFLYSSLLGFAIRRFGEPLVAWLCGVSQLPDCRP